MRFFLLLGCFMLGGISLLAQSTSVVVLSATKDATGLVNDLRLRSELQAQIDQVLAANTYGSLGCRLQLFPASSQRISGMAKVSITKYEFSLSFTDYVLDLPVGELITGTVSGNGGNDQEATTNALKKICKTYLSREKLQSVIRKHQALLPACDDLVSRLKKLNDTGHQTEVLAVYTQLSDGDKCSVEMESLVSSIYTQQQAADCRQMIIRAKAEVVAGNMRRAAQLLARVDPTLECADQAEALLDELMTKEGPRSSLEWYNTAHRSRNISPAVRRRIISNLVLEYAYNNY
ncbi:hypothetical protein [Neolewinella agarilytica]|nr:hypothetical protein [Neolewinella agarilytica]